MSLKHQFFALSLLALPLVSQAQKVVPTTVGTGTATRWTFTAGPVAMQTGAKNAGRIFSVTYNGATLLHMDTATNNSGSNTNYGSAFWPTPQLAWKSNWPPSVNIDGSGAYTATYGTDTALVLNGQTDANNNVRINKRYWVNANDTSINYHYTLINTGTAAKSWGPWEDTRIDTGGIYLFPKGTDTITGALATFTTKDSSNIVWYQHNASSTLASGTNKFYADGAEGWYAHVTAAGLVLIKKFADQPASKKAPTPENEIEFYATNKPLNNSSFIEMEAQGAYTSIAAGDSIQWDMTWYIRKLPDSMTVAPGNPAIVAFIRKVVAGGPTSVGGGNAIRQISSLGFNGNRATFNLLSAGQVSLSLMNAGGQLVEKIYAGAAREGRHDFVLKAAPKGVYWLVLKTSNASGKTGMEVKRVAFL